MDSCPTYRITGEPLFSPMHRLATAVTVFEGGEVSPLMMESVYNCPKCMNCETACPSEIKITEIVHAAREALVQRGLVPSEKHDERIEEIFEKGNAVSSDPARRLDWLPEDFPTNESDTLLYLGCLPSYLVKNVAISTYTVLKKLGVDFMILRDEGCCGIYIYESGRKEIAREYFQKNVDRFTALGIKKIIVPCAGCLKCFKYLYPDMLGEVPFTVHHAIETIYDALQENPDVLKKIERTVTYQDPCRASRGEGLIEEPREILRMCGASIREMEKNKEDAVCCGAGGGVRSIYPKLSLKIANDLLQTADAESVVTACPFCAFNLDFTSKRKRLGKDIIYFAEIVQESLLTDAGE